MINIYSQSGQVTYGIKYYTVDTENEKNSLPTKDKMGSKCYVIESETWYILNGNGEWVPFVGEDSTADAILISIKNMSAEQKDQLKEELDIEGGGGEDFSANFITLIPTNVDVFNGGTWTSDKTFMELLSAFNSGITIQVKINNIGFEKAQLLVYQNKGNVLYAHVRFYDGDQINGEFKIYQNGTYSYESSLLGANDVVTATGQMTEAQAAETAQNIGVAPLHLTATPTAGPDETTLMSGTWSGATWEEAVQAILATRLIQVDVANYGTITLLYNLASATNAGSNAFVYNVGGVLYNTFVDLFISEGNNRFQLTIINARAEPINVSGTTPAITPAANTIYNCGTLENLTITNPPASGAYSIVFTSGATPTVTTFPATILGLEDFAAEANTIYEINVLDNRAVVGSWAVSA